MKNPNNLSEIDTCTTTIVTFETVTYELILFFAVVRHFYELLILIELAAQNKQ
jgi:hypothetical protein